MTKRAIITDQMDSLMVQFLSWIAEQPRTYSQVMEAWRSSCPRLTIWEDALHNGFIDLRSNLAPTNEPATARRSDQSVRLSESGRTALRNATGESLGV